MKVTIESEGARFHLNALLQTEDRAQLQRIFVAWGLEIQEADTLIDRLLDWIDSDDLSRLQGAESEAYAESGKAGFPLNRPFRSLEEVGLVLGVDTIPNPERWAEWFTLWSSTGKLDLNAAPAPLLQAACESTPQAAQSFVQTRHGPDGLPQTEDDLQFPSVAEALTALGALEADKTRIAPRLTVEEPVKRVAIVAMIGDYGARREVVLTRQDPVRLHSWRDSILP